MDKKDTKKELQQQSISTKNGIFDYSKCLFEVRLTKKVFLGSQTRYVYCTPNSIVIAKEPYQKKPDKIVYLKPDWKVAWIYDAKKIREPFEKKILGFRLLTDTDVKMEYFGEVVVMLTLRDFFCRQLFQIKFLDEFEIQKKIGKGKYAKMLFYLRSIKSEEKTTMKSLQLSIYIKINQQPSKMHRYLWIYILLFDFSLYLTNKNALFNELKILRMINHPNCLKLIATYEDENGYYILTELLDSEKSLQGELIKYQNLQQGYEVVRNILKQLISAIEYVHSLGIMHRDLKPQNIMFTNNDMTSLQNLKVIDFGLAQFINDPHYIYVHVGTPGYVAPEILSNESDKHRYTEKCDIFSIGVVFHILLTGRSVFPGKKFSQVLQSNKECKIDFKGQKYEELDKDAFDLLLKLLEANPLKRPSATEALQHNFFHVSSHHEQPKVEQQPSASQVHNLSAVTIPPTQLLKEPEIPLKMPNNLIKGQRNLNRVTSTKDIDALQINFDELKQRMLSMVSMRRVVKGDKNQKRVIYKLAQDLVEVFIILEENQTDDLSFFASPLKPLHGIRNNMGDIVCVPKQMSQPDKNFEENQPKGLLSVLEVREEEEKGDKTKEECGINGNDNQNKVAILQYIENGDDEEEKKDYVEDIPPANVSKGKVRQDLQIVVQKEDGQTKQFPKKLMKLLNMFPSEILDRKMEGDLKKEGKQTVKLLGMFLLFGFDINEKSITDAYIQENIQYVKKMRILDPWFISLIQEMTNPILDLVPDFLYLKAELDKQLQALAFD